MQPAPHGSSAVAPHESSAVAPHGSSAVAPHGSRAFGDSYGPYYLLMVRGPTRLRNITLIMWTSIILLIDSVVEVFYL